MTTPWGARRIARHWPIVSGSVALLLAVGLGALIALRATPFSFDVAWMDEIVEHRAWWWDAPSRVMDFLGGGWFGVIVVPIAVLAVLLVRRRWFAALYFALASALSAGIVQLLKGIFGRTRPELMLVPSDFGSFPSGHVANAATLAVALGVIIGRTWVWLAGLAYAILMAISRTYLGVHWVSDTVGGFLLGAAVAIMLWAPLAERIRRERDST